MLVYTPEVGIDLSMLSKDVKRLKRRFQLDVKGKSEGRLVLRYGHFSLVCSKLKILYRNEQASSVYTTDVITQILSEEGAPLFDARSASLGHTLQGGIPSPTDRARAVRLASKCMAFLEDHAHSLRSRPQRRAPRESAAMITIEGTSISLTPVQDVVKHADMKKRRAVHTWWEGHKKLAEELGGLSYM